MSDKIQGSTVMLLRPTEAARALGLHPQTLANFQHHGGGPPFVKIGTTVRYSADALQEFVTANTKTPRRAG